MRTVSTASITLCGRTVDGVAVPVAEGLFVDLGEEEEDY